MTIRHFIAVGVALPVLVFSQTPVTPPAKFVNPWVSVAQPAIPADPLEAVTNATPVQGVEQRAAAIKLLDRAQYLSNVRREAPYDLKTQFTTSQGTWQIEDSSPGRNAYRWTVQGPSYSAVNLFLEQVIYSNQPPAGIPLRVAQEHSAIFGHYPAYGPRATLRLANGNLNGTAVTCVLVSHRFNATATIGPRRWEEYESCVDPQTGLLVSSSPVPGLYTVYDYSNAQHLGSVTFPGKFTITEAGQTVVEAQVVSLTQPKEADPALYTATGLNALGVGFLLTPPWRVEDIAFGGTPSSQMTNAQFVVVRGMVASDGTVTEADGVASSNASLNQKALARAAQPRPMASQDGQNGATPQSHEAFFITLFPTNQ